jgi:hypothetical protein
MSIAYVCLAAMLQRLKADLTPVSGKKHDFELNPKQAQLWEQLHLHVNRGTLTSRQAGVLLPASVKNHASSSQHANNADDKAAMMIRTADDASEEGKPTYGKHN